jgi:hypothetical protein
VPLQKGLTSLQPQHRHIIALGGYGPEHDIGVGDLDPLGPEDDQDRLARIDVLRDYLLVGWQLEVMVMRLVSNCRQSSWTLGNWLPTGI